MNENTITTNEVRLSYAHVFKPHAASPGQEERYSVTMLIPKSDQETMGRINAAMEAAKQKGLASKWNSVMPPQVLTPVWDGDGVRQDGTPFGPECKGCWVVTAGSKTDYPPEVYDQALNPILNQSEVYSGCYARVNVSFFAYNAAGRKGIGCGLNMLQKTRDGEPLAGTRMSAAEAFGAATVPPAAAPAPAYAATQTTQISPVYAVPMGAPTQTVNPVTGQPY